ncbi:MAG: FadR family transcriptional regulator [Sphingomonadales bacterium]|nr:FadR family transcriptional regulator [Sphingomonadales bacterium]MDE2169913.1 FadR family transcriptional regulator [Sphingomonadales bacterium]
MAGDSETVHGLRIHQSIARRLGMSILSGKVQPGDTLGGEIEESNALGISRTAYREAIRILIAKGLLESRPKAGTHVTPRRRWNLLDPDVLAWMFAAADPVAEVTATFVRDLFELRGVIEPAAAALAARRRNDEQIAAMRAGLEGMRSHGLASAEGQAADKDFHAAIMEAGRNEALASLTVSIGAAVRWTTDFKLRLRPDPRDPLPEHEAVFHAIEQRDEAGASAAMQELLRLSLQDMDLVLD